MRKLQFPLLFLTIASILTAEPQITNPVCKTASAFAILVDSVTNVRAETAILAYRDAVEKDGLATYIVSDDWSSPDDVKAVIVNLYHATPPIEGVVFIGDIPIPMIRDAQHLASAFKMDQERYKFPRSSVPSDRFYDDFDLKFDFLKQDTTDHLLFYYSLRADGSQKIEREIYSARIFPPSRDESKYIQIEKYLMRVARQKSAINRLDNALTFAGHGYHSESLDAWNNNLTALREQFPQFSQPGGHMTNLHFSTNSEMKSIILAELEKSELDLAIFHAHGGIDAQYLLGYPPAQNIDENVQAIRLFVRSKMRDARDRKRNVEETQKYYQEQYNLPDIWLVDALDDSVEHSDSLLAAKLDLYSSDVARIAPQAEIIIFDECFNGSFINPGYVAGTYLFGNGTTIAGVANSVNVKQDIWSDELLGVLSYGVRIGEWHRIRTYLESHLFGDPTFRFNGDEKIPDLQKSTPKDVRIWQKELKSAAPVRRTLAVRQIYRIRGADVESELIRLYHTDPSWNVRLEALKCLADLRSPGFRQILTESIDDPFELIRRFSATLMGVIGDEQYLPFLAEKVVFDASERVSYSAKSAIEKISPAQAYQACKKVFDSFPPTDYYTNDWKRLVNSLNRTASWLTDELIANVTNDTLQTSARIGDVRSFRNYQFRQAVPVLIGVASDLQAPTEVRVAALEALGWYAHSIDREQITAGCDRILAQHNLAEPVRVEALKTKGRISAGFNDPLNP